MLIITVCGATGKQGGSVVRHLMRNPTFTVRALTRDPLSTKAKELAQHYRAEPRFSMVQGNLDDADSLIRAFDGSHGVFAVTNFWEPGVGFDGEIRQGNNIAEACRKTNVRHIVFSTLDKNSGVPHFESKVLAEKFFEGLPVTMLITSFYHENLTSPWMSPNLDGKGGFVLAVAQKSATRVPMFSAYDTGGWVEEIFRNRETTIGKDVAAVSEYITYPSLVDVVSKATGKQLTFHELPLDVLRSAGFPGAEEIALNFDFFNQISEGSKHNRRASALKLSFQGEIIEEFARRVGWLLN